MLTINNQEYKVTLENISLGNTYKDDFGYNLVIKIEYQNGGYINLEFGFDYSDDINLFLNKNYTGIPFENDLIFEVFYNNRLYGKDLNDSLTLKLNKLENNQVVASIKLDDKNLNIEYQGTLQYIK